MKIKKNLISKIFTMFSKIERGENISFSGENLEDEYLIKIKVKKLFNFLYYFYTFDFPKHFVFACENKNKIVKSLYIVNFTSLNDDFVIKIYLSILKLCNINFYKYLEKNTPKCKHNIEYLKKNTNYIFFEDVEIDKVLEDIEKYIKDYTDTNNIDNEEIEKFYKKKIFLSYLLENLNCKNKYSFLIFNYNYKNFHQLQENNYKNIIIEEIIQIMIKITLRFKGKNKDDFFFNLMKTSFITINEDKYEIFTYNEKIKNLSILYYVYIFNHLMEDIKTHNFLNKFKNIKYKNNLNFSLFPFSPQNNFSYNEYFIIDEKELEYEINNPKKSESNNIIIQLTYYKTPKPINDSLISTHMDMMNLLILKNT